MTGMTRRGFVRSSAGAAAGVATLGALGADSAGAEGRKAGSDPLVAYVRDPRRGTISLMRNDREVTVHDPGLAARLARAAR
jgi:hypothetical protein